MTPSQPNSGIPTHSNNNKIIIIIKNESEVKGRKRVRTFYQSPTPHN